jgi:hypothetical protein
MFSTSEVLVLFAVQYQDLGRLEAVITSLPDLLAVEPKTLVFAIETGGRYSMAATVPAIVQHWERSGSRSSVVPG